MFNTLLRPRQMLPLVPDGSRMEVFVRGLDSQLYSISQVNPNSGWSGFMPMGGTLAEGARVSTQRLRNGGVALFARWNDGTIQLLRQNPTTLGWTSWQNLGGVALSDPASGTNADGRLEVFAIGSDRSLVHRWEPLF